MNQYLVTSDREHMPDQSKDITRTHLGELMCFIGVIYSNMSEIITYVIRLFRVICITKSLLTLSVPLLMTA